MGSAVTLQEFTATADCAVPLQEFTATADCAAPAASSTALSSYWFGLNGSTLQYNETQ